MNRFTQHIPSFVDYRKEPPHFDFETTEELVSSPLVRDNLRADFSHFAMSENALMQIADQGRWWWVMGYVKKPEEINLPTWSAPEGIKP